jgi:WD40 repeat protein
MQSSNIEKSEITMHLSQVAVVENIVEEPIVEKVLDEVENEDKINNNMIIWDVETGKKILTKKHKSQINSICFSSDNKYIAFGDADGNVIVLNAISGEEIKKFYIGRRIIVSHVSFFQDDKYITTACGNNVRIWKL